MRKVVKEYQVFKFNELNDNVKEKIVCDYIDYLMQVTDFDKISKNSNLYKAYKKANDMQTIWFLGSYIWDFCESQIMKEIEKCEYLENGEIFE